MWPPVNASSRYSAPWARASARARSVVTSVSDEQPTTSAGIPDAWTRAHSRRRSSARTSRASAAGAKLAPERGSRVALRPLAEEAHLFDPVGGARLG
jgi:hypothetical protein